jgi:predicted nucleic acid-binding protein
VSLQEASHIVLSSIVLGELQAGFLRGTRRIQNVNELRAFLGSTRVSVADVDSETALRYAEILYSLQRAGNPIPTNDIWIAATAMQHGLRVLTTDAHFQRVAQILVEYCDPETLS